MIFLNTLSIFNKILGSFTILTLGYLCTMVFFGVTTQTTLSSFYKKLKLLQDAVIMGDHRLETTINTTPPVSRLIKRTKFGVIAWDQ